MAVLYPLLQPPARFLTGVWLWRQRPPGRSGIGPVAAARNGGWK